MAAHHYPVLVWQDTAGYFTAALVGEFDDTAGRGGAEVEALRELKEFLEWRLENGRWDAEPDFNEPQLIEVKIEVRPQYKFGGRLGSERIVPAPETVWLRVPCVTGVQENGLRICVVPHLSLSFNYQDADTVKSLAAHYVKEHLHELWPGALHNYLPPQNCRLTEIVVRHSGAAVKRVAPADRPELKILFAVADPLLQNTGGSGAASAAYGREQKAEALAGKLRAEKSSLLLIGPAGGGKSTLLLDAARRFTRATKDAASENEDDSDAAGLRSHRFWRTTGGRLIAGMRYLGEWQERCEQVIAQLGNIAGVLCVESLLELLQTGGQSPADSVAAFLIPYLQRSELRLVAEATASEFEACRRLLPGFVDLFQPVHVPEFAEADALEVLRRVAHAHAAAKRVQVDPNALLLTQRLFQRFQPYAAFPGRAANFVRALIEQGAKSGAVTNGDVVTQFGKATGLPEIFLRDDLTLSVENVRAALAAKIIGQPEATGAAAQLIATVKAGLNDPARPYGSLLFCGPTGVGKTALAKALEEFCFGAGEKRNRLVRLDMSEYSGWGATQRLLQDADGNPAAWIERARLEPFCVVLFDEIEKAAPDVFDALLGLLDEGWLTDRFGRVTWFRSAIIIMTSNIGASSSAELGFIPSGGPSYEGEVARFFRPEFFNRLDAVIPFRPLNREDVSNITRKELADLAAREGFAASGLTLEWSDAVVELLAREGYDHRFGARPLQRVIERLVATPLARWLVAHPKTRRLTIRLQVDDVGAIIVRS